MKNFKKIISGVLSASMILTAAISGTSVSASASNTHRIGDVTGNGVVDLTDLTNLSQFLLGEKGSAGSRVTQRLDVNLDGIIDFKDMEQLRNIVTLGDTTGTVSYNVTAYDVIEQESREYIKYNMHTGTVVSTYTLDPVSMISTVMTMSLENEYVASNSTLNGVVRLNYSDSTKFRTGFVVGKHKILTAASCADVNTPASLPVSYTLFNTDGTEAGTYDIDYVHMEADYDLDTQRYNYAMLEVSENLSSRVMNLGVSRGNIVLANPWMRIAGYKSGTNTIESSRGYLTGNKIDFNYLYHNITNTEEKIGGPLYVLDDQDRAVVIGLNKSRNNSAIRITTDILHFVNNNPYIS